MKLPTHTKDQQQAMSGAWSYDQARDLVKELRKQMGATWGWLTPQVHEALIAERCLSVILRNSRGVGQYDMAKLLTTMRVIAGLIPVEEVLP